MQAVLECKQCGAQLDIDPQGNQKIVYCKFCGSANAVSFAERFGLYNRANYLRRNNEFDRAIGVYEDILKENAEDAEAYYGIALCKYGIEYVDDPGSDRKIPTCHRTRYTPMSQDVDFQRAMEYADPETAEIYTQEAERIDQIQKEILALSSREEKYDIFICYKESGEDGQRTKASVCAQDIYQELTRRGYKVFFARKTLEKKLGKQYEPIIFAALYSAKVMLVVGTEPAHFEAVWVKNEWSRYQERLAAGADCTLIPLYRDMSPYDLPQEFANLQALDMGRIGFLQDLTDGIEKLVRREEPVQTRAAGDDSVPDNLSVENLKKRAALFLEQGDFISATKYYERILDKDAEDADAYLGKLLAEKRISREEELAKGLESLAGDSNYQLALRFAGDELKYRLEYYENQIQVNIQAEQERREEEEKIRLSKRLQTARIEVKARKSRLKYHTILLFLILLILILLAYLLQVEGLFVLLVLCSPWILIWYVIFSRKAISAEEKKIEKLAASLQ